MKGNEVKKIIAATGTMMLVGCATIVSGSLQSISVNTGKVYGAMCELTDKKGGKWYVPTTPGTATVRKGDGPMDVVCRKEGYTIGQLTVEETIAGATFANILIGGGIGILVDAASGAAQQYPDQIVIWMEPEKFTSSSMEAEWTQARLEHQRKLEEARKSQQNSNDNDAKSITTK
ncbi:MAG: hypothetical protein H7833_12415 [Magnetococcus sp. DMHC-1]|nr:hypothetical protein [Magnetococcales bacterium]